jgi:hypothetical protein
VVGDIKGTGEFVSLAVSPAEGLQSMQISTLS